MEEDKEKLNDIFYKKSIIKIISIVILFIGSCLDYLNHINMPGIIVPKEYIYAVYGALVTVSIIGLTILSIIISCFSDKYFEFTVKEIINFKNKYISVSHVIAISLSSVIVSTFLLVFNLLNAITSILCVNVVIEILLSRYSWEIMHNENFCRKLINCEISQIIRNENNDKKVKLIRKMFKIYKLSFNDMEQDYTNNKRDEIKLCLSSIVRNKKGSKFKGIIAYEIKKSFPVVLEKNGYICAINEIIGLFKFLDYDLKGRLEENTENYLGIYDVEHIFLKPIDNIMYMNDEELNFGFVQDIMNGLQDVKIINNTFKGKIVYNSFKNVYDNLNISETLKMNILNDIFKYLLDYKIIDEGNGNDVYNEFKQEMFFYVIKDYLLTNNNYEINIKIFKKLASILFYKGKAARDSNKKIYETMGILFALMYIYTKNDNNKFNDEYEKKVNEFYVASEKTVNKSKISFKSSVSLFYVEIIIALCNNIESINKNYRFLNYRTGRTEIEIVDWSEDAIVDFLTYNFIIAYNRSYKKAFEDYIEHGDEKLLKKLNDCFDIVNKKFSDSISGEIEDMEPWLDFQIYRDESKEKTIMKKINTKLKNMSKVFDEINKEVLNKDKINSEIENELNDARYYGYDIRISLDDSEIYKIERIIKKEDDIWDEYLSRKCVKYCIEKFTNDIYDIIPVFTIDKNETGIENLKGKLKDEKYDCILGDDIFESYTFNKEKDDYKELIDNINKMNKQNSYDISEVIFFHEGKLNFNFDFVNCIEKELSDEECADYVENFKIGEGIYKMNSVNFAKSEIMELVKTNYIKKTIECRYKTNMDKNSGIILKVDFGV